MIAVPVIVLEDFKLPFSPWHYAAYRCGWLPTAKLGWRSCWHRPAARSPPFMRLAAELFSHISCLFGPGYRCLHHVAG